MDISVKINCIIGVFCVLPVFVAAQEAGEPPVEGSSIEARLREVPATVRAVRAVPNAPNVDGRLDDEAWRAAPPLTEFLQKNPIEGAVPSESTEVRFVYTDRVHQ